MSVYRYELREQANEVGRFFFSFFLLMVYIDEPAALYLSTLINTTTIHHFIFEMHRLSAFVQKWI